MMASIIKESIINLDPEKNQFRRQEISQRANHRAAKHDRASCSGKCQAQRGESAAKG